MLTPQEGRGTSKVTLDDRNDTAIRKESPRCTHNLDHLIVLRALVSLEETLARRLISRVRDGCAPGGTEVLPHVVRVREGGRRRADFGAHVGDRGETCARLGGDARTKVLDDSPGSSLVMSAEPRTTYIVHGDCGSDEV
jgi:hypothetical protein